MFRAHFAFCMITCQVSALAVMLRSRAWWWVLHQQGALWICYPTPQGRWRTRNFTNNNGYTVPITLKRYVVFFVLFVFFLLHLLFSVGKKKLKRKTNPKETIALEVSFIYCFFFVCFSARPVFSTFILWNFNLILFLIKNFLLSVK